jgi:hypothetical protein
MKSLIALVLASGVCLAQRGPVRCHVKDMARPEAAPRIVDVAVGACFPINNMSDQLAAQYGAEYDADLRARRESCARQRGGALRRCRREIRDLESVRASVVQDVSRITAEVCVHEQSYGGFGLMVGSPLRIEFRNTFQQLGNTHIRTGEYEARPDRQIDILDSSNLNGSLIGDGFIQFSVLASFGWDRLTGYRPSYALNCDYAANQSVSPAASAVNQSLRGTVVDKPAGASNGVRESAAQHE